MVPKWPISRWRHMIAGRWVVLKKWYRKGIHDSLKSSGVITISKVGRWKVWVTWLHRLIGAHRWPCWCCRNFPFFKVNSRSILAMLTNSLNLDRSLLYCCNGVWIDGHTKLNPCKYSTLKMLSPTKNLSSSIISTTLNYGASLSTYMVFYSRSTTSGSKPLSVVVSLKVIFGNVLTNAIMPRHQITNSFSHYQLPNDLIKFYKINS